MAKKESEKNDLFHDCLLLKENETETKKKKGKHQPKYRNAVLNV